MTPLALRTKLTLSYTAILVVLLAALGLVYYRTLSAQLDADATAEVQEVTSGLHGYLQFEQGLPVLDYDRNDPDEVSFVDRVARYFQVYNAVTGQTADAVAGAGAAGAGVHAAEVRAFREHPGIADVLTDNGRIRFSNSVITSEPGQTYLLQVGVRLASVDNALKRFVDLLLWSGPVCVLVAIVAGRWMAGRALAPLARLAAASRDIEISDLGRRLPVGGAGDELDHLALAFNETLSRLAHAVGEMKQFSAALAHELRTPLAAMRGEAELALLQARSPEEYQRTLSSQLEELDRLARLITQLLTLARAEAGEIRVAHESVDLAALTSGVVQSLAPVAQAREVAMSCDAASRGPRDRRCRVAGAAGHQSARQRHQVHRRGRPDWGSGHEERTARDARGPGHRDWHRAPTRFRTSSSVSIRPIPPGRRITEGRPRVEPRALDRAASWCDD